MLVMLGAVGVARAEDPEVPLGVSDAATSRPPDLWREGPWLALEPLPAAPRLESAGAHEEGERTAIDLGARTRLTLDGRWWISEDRPERPAVDVVGQGWRAGTRLTRRVGAYWLTAEAAIHEVDNRFGHGQYTEVGLSLTRTRRFSRWMTGWISIGVGARSWLGRPPAGESNERAARLTIGTTFR